MSAAVDPAAASVGQKRSRKDEDVVPTAPVPDALSLPTAAILRIIKSKLPDGVMLSTETKKAFGKACSLFILYLTTMCVAAGRRRPLPSLRSPLAHPLAAAAPAPARRAADVAKEGNRSTVNGTDVLAALRDLEFDDFMPSVESALAAWREAEKARSIEAAAKRAAKLAGEGGDEQDEDQEEQAEGEAEEEDKVGDDDDAEEE